MLDFLGVERDLLTKGSMTSSQAIWIMFVESRSELLISQMRLHNSQRFWLEEWLESPWNKLNHNNSLRQISLQLISLVPWEIY